MRIIKKLILIIIILAVLALLGRRYLGGFTKLTVTEKDMGPYTMAYVPFVGSYYKVGPAMEDVHKAVQADGIKSEVGIGIYYDNPDVTPADELRSDVGDIIPENDISKLDAQSSDYKIKTIPAAQSVVIEFPTKNMLSYMIAPMRVYPVLNKYINDKGYAMEQTIEIYDMAASKSYYIVNIK